jgi:hypothetical protein
VILKITDKLLRLKFSKREKMEITRTKLLTQELVYAPLRISFDKKRFGHRAKPVALLFAIPFWIVAPISLSLLLKILKSPSLSNLCQLPILLVYVA